MLVGPIDRAVEAMPLVVALGLQRQEHTPSFACLRPPVEAIEHGLPRSELRWKVAPQNPRATPPQHRFDKVAVVRSRPSGSPLGLQKSVDLGPLPLRKL